MIQPVKILFRQVFPAWQKQRKLVQIVTCFTNTIKKHQKNKKYFYLSIRVQGCLPSSNKPPETIAIPTFDPFSLLSFGLLCRIIKPVSHSLSAPVGKHVPGAFDPVFSVTRMNKSRPANIQWLISSGDSSLPIRWRMSTFKLNWIRPIGAFFSHLPALYVLWADLYIKKQPSINIWTGFTV